MLKQDPFVQYSVTSFYHFTDQKNAASIRERGGLYSLAALREMGIEIPAPGGNDWSHDADAMKGLDQYVHLCFRPNHPMEYVARQDGRITDPVYLQIHPDHPPHRRCHVHGGCVQQIGRRSHFSCRGIGCH